MKDPLHDLFSMSANERRGVIVLVAVILLIMAGKQLLISYGTGQITFSSDWLKDTLEVLTPEGDTTGGSAEPWEIFNSQSEPVSFYFDPNTVSYEDLVRLGTGKQAARNVVKYRSKGGRFYRSADLQKIYGFHADDYSRLKNYMRFDIPQPVRIKEKNIHSQPLEINRADSAQLVNLPGIGPVLAARIVKYRSLLGGYSETGQLNEVYGISDSLVVLIGDRIWSDTNLVRKINVNTATEQELAKHPYIGRYVARGIMQYRMKVGTIKNLDELSGNNLIRREVWNKARIYLTI